MNLHARQVGFMLRNRSVAPATSSAWGHARPYQSGLRPYFAHIVRDKRTTGTQVMSVRVSNTFVNRQR